MGTARGAGLEAHVCHCLSGYGTGQLLSFLAPFLEEGMISRLPICLTGIKSGFMVTATTSKMKVLLPSSLPEGFLLSVCSVRLTLLVQPLRQPCDKGSINSQIYW